MTGDSVKQKKGERPPVEVAAETGGVVRGAAQHSARVARHLLRRTRLLTREAAQRLPVVSALDAAATEGHITIVLPETVLPETPPYEDGGTAREAQLTHELAQAQARAQRAELAAAWLRARLRAERARRRDLPPLDVAALSADLARELARLHAPPQPQAVQRLVQRTLAAHGLSQAPDNGERAGRVPDATDSAGRASEDTGHTGREHHRDKQAEEGAAASHALPWPREQQEMLAGQVLRRAPEVADPSYVYRALALLAGRRLSLPQVVQASGLTSAMSRRRLRLAVEALVAIGAVTSRDGAYALNKDWRPVQQRRSPRSH